MRICVLFEGDIYHLRGEFMAIHNRMKYLTKDPSLSVSVFIIQRYYDILTCWFRSTKPIERKKDFFFEGIHYHCLYYKRSYLDYFCRSISKRQTTIEAGRVGRFKKLFFNFDLIYAHSLYTGLLALDIKQKKGIPFATLWHGSSIHTFPFQNKTVFSQTRKVLLGSNHNFFVSKALHETAKLIAGSDFKGSVSSNGVDTQVYYPYQDEMKVETARRLQIDLNNKHIAYIGNYLPIKNVKYLPTLFASIYKAIPQTHFHIIGNGNFAADFEGKNLPVTFWGNQLPENMPDLYNCMNLVVLPSQNEGLPMTCLEAMACGTAFVGSRVGGIADAIGIDNTVPLSDTFEMVFGALCVKKLLSTTSHSISLPDRYNVEKIVRQELEVMKAL